MPGAVLPFERLQNREKPLTEKDRKAKKEAEKPKPTDVIFPGNHVGLFNNILGEQKLKFDRDGNRRTRLQPSSYLHLSAFD